MQPQNHSIPASDSPTRLARFFAIRLFRLTGLQRHSSTSIPYPVPDTGSMKKCLGGRSVLILLPTVVP